MTPLTKDSSPCCEELHRVSQLGTGDSLASTRKAPMPASAPWMPALQRAPDCSLPKEALFNSESLPWAFGIIRVQTIGNREGSTESLFSWKLLRRAWLWAHGESLADRSKRKQRGKQQCWPEFLPHQRLHQVVMPKASRFNPLQDRLTTCTEDILVREASLPLGSLRDKQR